MRSNVPASPRQIVRRGMTMVELLIVVVLLGVIAVSALSFYSQSDQDIATAGAMMVMRDLEFAQSEAVRRQTSVTVSFLGGSPQYTVKDSSGPLTNPFTKKAYPTSLATVLDNDRVKVAGVNLGGSGTVTFSAMGEPLTSAGLPVASSNYIIVSCGTKFKRLHVTPLTGQPYVD